MFSLKDIVFNFFGVRDRTDDLFKDGNNRGLNQRFNELLAKDLDDNEIQLINLLVENNCDPYQCLTKFLDLREATFAMPTFTGNEYKRRKIIALISQINKRKGTVYGYTILFYILGFQTVEITEIANIYGFDSPTTFDSPSRRFDMKCHGCLNYTIALTGTMDMNDALYASIMAVIEYNEPIDADLIELTYNGNELNIPPGEYSDDFDDSFYN